MLFDKDIPQICAYCLYGQDYGEDAVLCSKKGPMEPQDHCGRFVYDPLRRKPAPGATFRPVKDKDAFRL